MPTANPQIVVAAVIWQQRRLLICQRQENDSFPLQWEFPGGKVELNEEPPAALERELQEELGIRARVGAELWRTEHQYPGRTRVQLLFFEVSEFEGVPENRVFQQIRWAEPQELTTYDFLEADRPLIARLAAGKLSPQHE